MASRAYNLEEFIRILESWGLRDVMLPFLLVFVTFFAIMHRAKIFGEGKDKMNLVLALVVGLIFVVPHVTNSYPSNMDPVDILNEAIPNISIVAMAAIGALILIGTLGGQVTERPLYATGGVVLTAATIYVIWVHSAAAPLIIGIMVTLLIMNFFSRNTKWEGIVEGSITVISFLIVLYFFGAARGWFTELPEWVLNPLYQGVIIFTLILTSLVFYVFGNDD